MGNFVSNDNATTLFGDVGKKKVGWDAAASSVKKNMMKVNISDLKANNTTGTWAGNTYAVNSVSFAVTTDNRGYVLDISASTGSGGATANTQLYFGQNVALPKGSYHMNGCPSNGSDTTFFWQYRKQSGNLTYRDIGTDRTESATPNIFTLADDTTFDWVGIAVLSGTVITTPITFKSMIRLASVKNSDYAPWIPDNAELDEGKVAIGKVLSNSDDLDNIKATGIYTATTAPTNSPESTTYFKMLVIARADDDVQQVIFRGDTIYMRNRGGYPTPVWNAWKKVTLSAISS